MSQSDTGVTSSIASRAGGFVVLLGFFVFLAPIVFTGFGTIILSNVLAGAAIASIGAILVAMRPSNVGVALALSGVVVLLGAWIVASPFTLEVNTDTLRWANVILGALVVVFTALATAGSLRGDQSSPAA